MILNVMRSLMIVKLTTRTCAAADRISTGDMEIQEFPETGKDGVAQVVQPHAAQSCKSH